MAINGHRNGGSNASPLMAINGYASLLRSILEFYKISKTLHFSIPKTQPKDTKFRKNWKTEGLM